MTHSGNHFHELAITLLHLFSLPVADYNNTANYRARSILPIFSKALGNILHSRLISLFYKHGILSGPKFGFREKKKEAV